MSRKIPAMVTVVVDGVVTSSYRYTTLEDVTPDTEAGSSGVSPGTALTRGLASSHSRPVRTVGQGDVADTFKWLQNQGTELTVNIAGPRESEWPGAYEASFRIVGDLLRLSAGSQPSASA